MNRDTKLAILSFVALVISLIIAAAVLSTDPDKIQGKSSKVDRQLLRDTSQAEPLGQRGSHTAFHWIMERLIQGEL